jgi:hypothetical protein
MNSHTVNKQIGQQFSDKGPCDDRNNQKATHVSARASCSLARDRQGEDGFLTPFQRLARSTDGDWPTGFHRGFS